MINIYLLCLRKIVVVSQTQSDNDFFSLSFLTQFDKRINRNIIGPEPSIKAQTSGQTLETNLIDVI